MSLGRIPAQSVHSLADENTLSSSKAGTDADIMHDNVRCQQLPWFNYCDHLPESPQFFKISPQHKRRSQTIMECIRRLCDSYFSPRKQLSTLQNHLDTGNQVKSQRRNACIVLIQAMLYYVDDATGRVGRRMDDGSFKDVSLKKLADYAGLRFKRAKRAMHDIVKAGYISVTRQFTRAANGEYIGLPSIREILPKLFIELDVKGEMWQKWFFNKQWNKERADKKITKEGRKKARAMFGLINEGLKQRGRKAMSGFSNMVKKITPQKAPNIEHEKKLLNLAIKLHKENPAIEASEFLKELKSKYPPPS